MVVSVNVEKRVESRETKTHSSELHLHLLLLVFARHCKADLALSKEKWIMKL